MPNSGAESRWSSVLRYAAWTVCALPLIVGGQSRPSLDPGNRSLAQQGPTSGSSAGSPGEGRHGRLFGPPGRQAREEEWTQAEQFFKDNAPNYLAKVEKLTLSEQRMRQLHNAMVARFETLQRLSEHFPELYEVRRKQLQLFDTLFATHEQYQVAGDNEKERLRGQMKQELAELFANSLKDRQTRINRIQEMLGKLQGSVEQDTHHQQELVDAHYKKVLDKGVDPSLLDGLVKDDTDTGLPEHGPHRNRPGTLTPGTLPSTP